MMQSGKCCVVCKLIGLLVIIGAINWGLVGAFKTDLVVMLLGSIPKAVRIVYILVGLAGLMKLVSCFKPCPCCAPKGDCSSSK